MTDKNNEVTKLRVLLDERLKEMSDLQLSAARMKEEKHTHISPKIENNRNENLTNKEEMNEISSKEKATQ